MPSEALVNYYAVDPRTGKEYLRVQASAAIATAARCVVVNSQGQAAGSVAASKGRFGINVGTARVDDDYYFAFVGGEFEAPSAGAGFMLAGVSVDLPVIPAAGAAVTVQSGTAADSVFGWQVLVKPVTTTTRGKAFLSRPHTIGNADLV